MLEMKHMIQVKKKSLLFLKKVGIHSMQAEQSVRGMELKEKEEKD